jgi:CBS domain containing-hemolysin-like protein
MNSYHAIPTLRLNTHVTYTQPPTLPELTHINDPALSIMVDFKYHEPPTISALKSLDQAKADMQAKHLPVLIVADEEKNVLGVITSEDILGEKPVKMSQDRRIPRSEIEVEMIMTPKSEIFAMDIDDLHHAKVGHIIQTLRETKQHTLLVIQIDQTAHQQIVRGLFSASLISKQLDQDITLVLSEAQSIAELQHGLHQ